MNNSSNANDSLQYSLQASLKATYVSITISAILAFSGFITAGTIGFFLLKHSKVTSVNLGVLMLVNLGVGIYNVFAIPKLFAQQATLKDKLLYLEMREVS